MAAQVKMLLPLPRGGAWRTSTPPANSRIEVLLKNDLATTATVDSAAYITLAAHPGAATPMRFPAAWLATFAKAWRPAGAG